MRTHNGWVKRVSRKHTNIIYVVKIVSFACVHGHASIMVYICIQLHIWIDFHACELTDTCVYHNIFGLAQI